MNDLSPLEVLSLMSLIKIDENGRLLMHDQLRDLGREIVRRENPKEPQKCSRLCIAEEALDVLDNNEGTKKIEALSLGKCGKGRRYTAKKFKKMTNLRFLQVDGANFIGDFQSLLPELRWLQWEGCPSDFAATNFHPKKLVVLDLSYSAISEDWGGWVPLKAYADERTWLGRGAALSEWLLIQALADLKSYGGQKRTGARRPWILSFSLVSQVRRSKPPFPPRIHHRQAGRSVGVAEMTTATAMVMRRRHGWQCPLHPHELIDCSDLEILVCSVVASAAVSAAINSFSGWS